MTTYAVRTVAKGFRMVKFDDMLNPDSIYTLTQRGSHFNCECFQANKSTCRHREMLPKFIAKKAVNTGQFYDYEAGRWLPAIKC